MKPNATDRFLAKLAASLQDGTFVRLVLTGPTTSAQGAERALARLVNLRGQDHLTITLRHARQDLTRNIPLTEAVNWARGSLGSTFRNALLGTTTRDWQLAGAGTAKARLAAHQPAITATPSRQHDRQKSTVLDQTAHDWLSALDVTTANGDVRTSMSDKWIQINRYLDIFAHLATDCGWTRNQTDPLVVADMGCGKGYLTFGLWHLLRRTWNRPVCIIGIESRAELVARTNAVAQRIGADGLEFQQGDIASVPLPPLDCLIALHACNTATDDALRRGIEANAKLIVVAPCCHQELRPQLGRPEPLDGVLRHGLMAERMAEWVTDGLRILFLEWAGYRVKAIEFVGGEHTPKNLMLAAIKKAPGFTDPQLRQRIIDYKAFFGITSQALPCTADL